MNFHQFSNALLNTEKKIYNIAFGYRVSSFDRSTETLRLLLATMDPTSLSPAIAYLINLPSFHLVPLVDNMANNPFYPVRCIEAPSAEFKKSKAFKLLNHGTLLTNHFDDEWCAEATDKILDLRIVQIILYNPKPIA